MNDLKTLLGDLTANVVFSLPSQLHPFFTGHELKETDVATFVTAILGD